MAGCGDDDGPAGPGDLGQPPALPDESSLSIDLSAFLSPSSKWVIQPQTPSDSSSYLTARATLAIVNLAILYVAAPAAAAFQGAFGATPVHQADGSWTWSYIVTYDSRSFALALNGKAAADESQWSMRVTTTGLGNDLTDYLWYSGAVATAGDEGYWQLYDPMVPATPTNALRVDWQVASADNRTAVWVNNRIGGAGEGDSLTYLLNEDAASVSFRDASNGVVSAVEWSVDTTAGSITVPFYNQGARACWDSGHLNAPCAP